MFNSLLKLRPLSSIMSLLRPLYRLSSLPSLRPPPTLNTGPLPRLISQHRLQLLFPNPDICLAFRRLLYKYLLGWVPLPSFSSPPSLGLLLNFDHLPLKLLPLKIDVVPALGLFLDLFLV